jgi:hypothetical protein
MMSETLFVISEEQLKQIRDMIFHEDEVKFEISWKIVSHSLSAELKKERERVLDELIQTVESEQQKQYAFFYPCFDKNTIVPIKEWGMSLETIISKAQILRGEP